MTSFESSFVLFKVTLFVLRDMQGIGCFSSNHVTKHVPTPRELYGAINLKTLTWGLVLCFYTIPFFFPIISFFPGSHANVYLH